jgi:hypothetical protein
MHKKPHRKNRKWLCVDCGECTKLEHYFVKNTVWQGLANMPEAGMLHVLCLERRIGRKLNPTDFTDAHINNPKTNSMTNTLRSRILGV